MKKKILIVEDTISELNRYQTLAEKIWTVEVATCFEEVKKILDIRPIDICLTDIHLSRSLNRSSYEGYDVIQYIRENYPEILILAMSSDPRIETYNRTHSLGVRSFVKKPILSEDELRIAVESANHNDLLYKSSLSHTITLPHDIENICQDGVVLDPYIRKRVAGMARRTDAVTVIYGESGTGKEEVAKLIHKRRVELEGHVPFVPVNCANLDTATATSRLFGHKKGSFTGASETTVGLIGEANGGILFLDEIHRLSTECQARLLRVLNDGTYERLGDTRTLCSSFQVIVASTLNLDKLVLDESFLIDLRSRLTGIEIYLKPLRERFDELNLLVKLFFAKEKVSISHEQIETIVSKCSNYYWQGNIRQLFNVLKSLVITCEMDEIAIDADLMPEFITMFPPQGKDRPVSKQNESFPPIKRQGTNLNQLVYDFEKSLIIKALSEYRKIGDVAAKLGISRSSLDNKRKKFGI